MDEVAIVFIIAALGYVIGCINIRNIKLGTSAVLLVALVFGHFGYTVSPVLKTMGLVIFVGAVGMISGPSFFKRFNKKYLSSIAIGLLISLLGAILVRTMQIFSEIPDELILGLYSGALTSTPALAVASGICPSKMVPIGYGVSYPFGVVGVIIFVQIMPHLLGIKMSDAVAAYQTNMISTVNTSIDKTLKKIDPQGFVMFSITIILGLFLGKIEIPLGSSIKVSLGNTGGPLFMGLIMGNFFKIGKFSIKVPDTTLKVIREFGLMLFLTAVGLEAGNGFIETVQVYGFTLFMQGVVITLVPLLVAFIILFVIMKSDILNTLGVICGGMTSTPALGALIATSNLEDVTVSYATAYPVAIISTTVFSQLLALMI